MAKASDGGMRFYKSYGFRDQDPIVATVYACFKARESDYATLHADSGVSVATLQKWFSGETKRPQYATVMAVLHALGFDIPELVDMQGQGKRHAKISGKAKELSIVAQGEVRKRFPSAANGRELAAA